MEILNILLITATSESDSNTVLNQVKIDPAILNFLSLIIGSLITLVVSWINNNASLKRETAQWNRQRQEKIDESNLADIRDRDNKVSDCMKVIISNSAIISKLGDLIRDGSFNVEENMTRFDEAMKLYSSLLTSFAGLINLMPDIMKDKSFVRDYYQNMDSPVRHSEVIRHKVMSLILGSEKKEVLVNTGRRTFILSMSDEAIKRNFLDGIEVSQNKIVELNLFDMTRSQREILAAVYPAIVSDNLSEDQSIYLPFPYKNPKDGEIKQGFWGANYSRLDDYTQLFEEWENDYNTETTRLQGL